MTIGLTKEQIKELMPQAETEEDIKKISCCATYIMRSLSRIYSKNVDQEKKDDKIQKYIDAYLQGNYDMFSPYWWERKDDLKSFLDLFLSFDSLTKEFEFLLLCSSDSRRKLKMQIEISEEYQKIGEEKAKLIEDYENFNKWKEEELAKIKIKKTKYIKKVISEKFEPLREFLKKHQNKK